MKIPQFTPDTPPDQINSAIEEAGCAVVTGLMDADLRSAIKTELMPSMSSVRIEVEDDPEAFYPGLTRRVTALATRSPAVTEHLIAHPVSLSVCNEFLLPNSEFGYQVHVTAALEVGPGARRQELHREEDSFTFFDEPRPNIIVASMWAISDFRANNGGTLIVPGSHKWPKDRVAKDHEVVAAEMPAGSVLFWSGGLLHGAGANTSEDWRYGVILTYSLGWVRQEENQYLNIPRERFEALSPEIRKLLGFDMYSALGFYDPSVGS